MPPRKNKRRAAAAKSTSEEVVSSKKSRKASAATKPTKEDVLTSKRPLKRLRKAIIDSESTPEEVVSNKKIVEDQKGDDAKEPVPTPKVKKKPCTWLKLDRLNPELGSKSLQSSKQGKESEPAAEVTAPEDNKRKRNEKSEEKGHSHPVTNEKQNSRGYKKKAEPAAEAGDPEDNKRKRNEKREEKGRSHQVTNEKRNSYRDEREKELIKEIDDEDEKELGGLIFMCNSKTKPDCFRYQIMGVPAHKKEVVMSIKPGLKFFLYDYDLKLMYGVFEASSAGGMKLEPAAFDGAFPAQVNRALTDLLFSSLIICTLFSDFFFLFFLQVRFIVHKACLPLPESVFKKAIKGSYDEKRRKFQTELTVKQVRFVEYGFRMCCYDSTFSARLLNSNFTLLPL